MHNINNDIETSTILLTQQVLIIAIVMLTDGILRLMQLLATIMTLLQQLQYRPALCSVGIGNFIRSHTTTYTQGGNNGCNKVEQDYST